MSFICTHDCPLACKLSGDNSTLESIVVALPRMRMNLYQHNLLRKDIQFQLDCLRHPAFSQNRNIDHGYLQRLLQDHADSKDQAPFLRNFKEEKLLINAKVSLSILWQCSLETLPSLYIWFFNNSQLGALLAMIIIKINKNYIHLFGYSTSSEIGLWGGGTISFITLSLSGSSNGSILA